MLLKKSLTSTDFDSLWGSTSVYKQYLGSNFFFKVSILQGHGLFDSGVHVIETMEAKPGYSSFENI